MILRMGMRAPASLIVAMIMSFYISPRLASVYLIAVLILACVLFLIISRVTKIFDYVFKKYDDLNASVQENISGIRVVKAYVREDFEKEKFQKASGNIYKFLLKAERILACNCTGHDDNGLYLYPAYQLAGSKDDRDLYLYHR